MPTPATVTISSLGSVASPPDLFFYGSSKACLDRLTTALEAEAGGSGVTFNSVQVVDFPDLVALGALREPTS